MTVFRARCCYIEPGAFGFIQEPDKIPADMIDFIEFRHFRALRETRLPLSPFTLVIGPNGSGKSTALEGLSLASEAAAGGKPKLGTYRRLVTVDARGSAEPEILINFEGDIGFRLKWLQKGGVTTEWTAGGNDIQQRWLSFLAHTRVFELNAKRISLPVKLQPQMALDADGYNLAGVLDGLRDLYPERFESLNHEMNRWFPEYDRILFETRGEGVRGFRLRLSTTNQSLHSEELSHGTLLALIILTLAYLAEPPSIVCLEEPDKGIHPRLLQRIKDAIYRLSYPEACGEERNPVQVIATTHSPYFLDLFKEHPEEIVIASKQGSDATFQRLSGRNDMKEILDSSSPLGELWYSGILGGVPSDR